MHSYCYKVADHHIANPRKLIDASLDDVMDELISEYETEIDSSAREYFSSIPTSESYLSHNGKWNKTTAHVAIPGPWQRSECFWMDVISGECRRVDADTDLLTPQELIDHEMEVIAADRAIQAAMDIGKQLNAAQKSPSFKRQRLQ